MNQFTGHDTRFKALEPAIDYFLDTRNMAHYHNAP